MNRFRVLAVVLVSTVLLQACGNEEVAETETVVLNDYQGPAVRQEARSGPLVGEDLFIACQGCHALKAGEPHGVGPNLNGLMGQAAASRPGFVYSQALQDSGIIWSNGTLTGWIVAAESMVAGTWMAYHNVIAEIQTLVAYINEASAASE